MDIAQNHPDRTVKITVVRATLEALVAQGRVRRTKQGRSVFYHSTTPVKETPTAN
jgi:DNA-binding transcriptional regulator PaaX